jgi:hypothetical protein
MIVVAQHDVFVAIAVPAAAVAAAAQDRHDVAYVEADEGVKQTATWSFIVSETFGRDDAVADDM